jgi:hypothetical protein
MEVVQNYSVQVAHSARRTLDSGGPAWEWSPSTPCGARQHE